MTADRWSSLERLAKAAKAGGHDVAGVTARLAALVANLDCHWNLVGPAEHDCVDVPVADLRAILSQVERLTAERERLREALVTVERILAGIPAPHTNDGAACVYRTADDVPEDIFTALSFARAPLTQQTALARKEAAPTPSREAVMQAVLLGGDAWDITDRVMAVIGKEQGRE